MALLGCIFEIVCTLMSAPSRGGLGLAGEGAADGSEVAGGKGQGVVGKRVGGKGQGSAERYGGGEGQCAVEDLDDVASLDEVASLALHVLGEFG
jgi:hypothetical protein